MYSRSPGLADDLRLSESGQTQSSAGAGAWRLPAATVAACDAKSEFLAVMSHELKTPLNAIVGFADLLHDELGADDGRRLHVERIRCASAALLTIINDILDFSRIEAGEIELKPRPFAVRALIDDTMAIVGPDAARKGLALDAAVAPSIPKKVVGDEDRLRQVVLNLLVNAIKFTPSGRIDVAVELAAVEFGRVQLRVSIVDTGIGIPASDLDRLFKRFSQVDGTIRRQHGGTGLGLAIAKQLVELMGGYVGVKTHAGHGSTFYFTVWLPVVAEAAAPSAGQVSQE